MISQKLRFNMILLITLYLPTLGLAGDQLQQTHPNPGEFKLAIASYAFREKDLDEVIHAAIKMNVKRLALKSVHLPLDNTDEQIREVQRKIREAGLEAYAGSVIYMKTQKEVSNAFDYAKKAGFEMIIGVPAPELMDFVEEKVKEYDIRMAIHNHGSRDGLYPCPESVYEALKDRDKRMGLCIDVGHTTRLNLDPAEEIRKYADRLLDIHIWDCSSASDEGKAILPGYGVLNFEEILHAVIDIHYTGTVAVEFWTDPKDPEIGTAQTLGYIQGILSTFEIDSDQAVSTLTEEEKKEGWHLLFDGKRTNGWRGINRQDFPETGWSVKNGQLCIKESGGGESQYGGDIITEKQYGNFELKWEWKMLTRGGNSGLKYFVLEGLSSNPEHGEGLEYQILDDANHEWMLDGKMKPGDYHTVGSLYEVYAAKDKKLMLLGQYNQSRIVCKGNHVEHWLNGIKVLEFERGSEDFNRRVRESKFKNIKGFGLAPKGHILLQDHGSHVCFRNIKIREFDDNQEEN